MGDVLFKRHTKGLEWAEGASQVVLAVKNPPANAGDIRDVGSIPGSEKISRKIPWRRA